MNPKGELTNNDVEKFLGVSDATVTRYLDDSANTLASWRNAINQGIDVYPQGEAGGANANTCPPLTYCNFYIPSPDATADWYLKLGLEQ